MADDSPKIRDENQGRGAVSNITGRFAVRQVDPFDDGWGTLDEPVAKLETTVAPDRARSILAQNDSPDVPFARSINPYRGSEHGCVYCFARPTHAYLDLSPGLDFESRIFAKHEAASLLRRELSRPRYRCSPIALGANTDPYQPVERRLRITRSIIEVLAECDHPVSIVTKSALVIRDLDLLRAMAAKRLAAVFVSITTLDRVLARRMEPRAATPERRLEAVRQLADEGVPVGVLASPMIPALNESELESILAAARAAGACYANYILVRLPWEVKHLVAEWLGTHYPERKEKVLARLRAMRGGRLNDPRFASRMRGEGPFSDLLERRFEVASRRLGFDPKRIDLDTSSFHAPSQAGVGRSLFD